MRNNYNNSIINLTIKLLKLIIVFDKVTYFDYLYEP